MADAKESKEPARTEHGHLISEAVSAYQKELRRGDIEAATYWGLLVFRKTPSYIWRRTMVAAAEGVGMAAPEVVIQVGILNQMYRAAAEGSWSTSPHHLTMAITLICQAPKSTAVEDLQTLVLESIKDGQTRPVPEYAKDAHTKAGKAAGRSWRDWYSGRLSMGIPLNEYVHRIWKLRPAWRPPEVPDPEKLL